MEEIHDGNMQKSVNPVSNIRCLICASREVDESTITEELKLFEQLIGQEIDDKIQIDAVGFCKNCKQQLQNYKKLKMSCVRAWKKHRESTKLVPVIVTPELKLFRIEEPQSYYTSKSEQSSYIPKVPVVVKKLQPQVVKVDKDPLCTKSEVKSGVRYLPYNTKPVSSVGPSQALIKINYCYVCKSVKSDLKKHLLLAHCLYDKALALKTCSECGLKCNDENSFFRHFEHYHNERSSQRPAISSKKRAAVPVNLVNFESRPSSNIKKIRNIQPKIEIKQDEDAT